MKVLFVFAHPDDETFSSGGTIPLLVKSGAVVNLVTATKGEAGQVGEPAVTTQDNLGEVREKELRKAAKILGISHIFFLDLIDGTLQKSIKLLNSKIQKVITNEHPDIVVTFDKTGGSNHPDHIAVGKATARAFEIYRKSAGKHVRLYHTVVPKSYLKKYEKIGLTYTAFGKIKGTADENITTIIDISQTYPIKVKAFKCHKSQQKDWKRFLRRTKHVDLKKEFFKLVSENRLV